MRRSHSLTLSAAAACLAAFALCAAPASAQDRLMVVDSGNDRVLLLDAFDGSVVNANFITDTTRFVTAINAIDSGRGTVLISDQLADAVFEYSLAGTYLGTIADASDGLDNVRGIAARDGQLYVTVAGGTLGGTIQRFNLDGTGQTTWANLGAANDSPWDIYFRQNDVLITDSTSDDVLRYDLAGTLLGNFVTSDGVNNIDFPQQIQERGNGNVLVGGFSAPAGVYEFNGATGSTVSFFSPPSTLAVRGVFQLGNGEVLYTGGTRLERVNLATGVSTQILNQAGASFRFIERVNLNSAAVPEPGTFALLALAAPGLLALRRRRR